MHIDDLHFKKEILPLFDFLHNEFSRDSLADVLADFPESEEEVLTRQRILQCLIRNEALRITGAYHKSEFNEVYGYLEGIRHRGNVLSGSSLRIHWLFARSEKNRDRGKLGQLVLFFYRIDQTYFSHLKEEEFPVEFGSQIKRSKQFLLGLGVKKYQAIARERGLRTGEMAALLKFLGEKIRQGEMDIFWKDFFQFEAYLSIAKGILVNRFVFPVFKNAGLSISRFYHPLVKDPVRNDLVVKERVILITGPNMSGKSTLLKAIGICVVLARLGLAVPAERCELPFFELLSISINLNDDLKSGYSHFMAEIKSLKNVVVAADGGKACFAVFDELFRGTNAEDALAISATTINGLTKFSNSYFFISTHLHQLKEALPSADKLKESLPEAVEPKHGYTGANDGIGTYYLECKLDNQQPVFTYVLQRGWSDLKIGQLLFDREGLNRLLGKAE